MSSFVSRFDAGTLFPLTWKDTSDPNHTFTTYISDEKNKPIFTDDEGHLILFKMENSYKKGKSYFLETEDSSVNFNKRHTFSLKGENSVEGKNTSEKVNDSDRITAAKTKIAFENMKASSGAAKRHFTLLLEQNNKTYESDSVMLFYKDQDIPDSDVAFSCGVKRKKHEEDTPYRPKKTNVQRAKTFNRLNQTKQAPLYEESVTPPHTLESLTNALGRTQSVVSSVLNPVFTFENLMDAFNYVPATFNSSELTESLLSLMNNDFIPEN